jgi:CDP-diacylglycerol--serine O-phosphatidyltransferase
MNQPPDNPPPDRHARPGRLHKRHAGRHRILRATAVLPSVVTLGNLLAGFASIFFATRESLGQTTMLSLWLAAWMIAVAMVCDMLDGRLARMTRKTSDFGGQLDSLCDVVSFGVAPAILAARISLMGLRSGLWPQLPQSEQWVWCAAAVYVSCAALRLARFNVENVPDESAHMHFRGLPSPAAAGLIVTMALMLVHADWHWAWASPDVLLGVWAVGMPVATLACGLLMVSRLPYPHVVNQYLRGKRPFGYLVKIVVILLAALLDPFVTSLAVAAMFVLSGPVRWAWRVARGR